MYTVRVQSADVSHTLPCAQYTLTRGAQGSHRTLTLYGVDGALQGQTPVLTLAIEVGTTVFIMNSDGNTIDTIRASGDRR